MFPTKASGPNGFLVVFYQSYWDVVGPQTIVSCLEILNSRNSVKGWNQTNIALIPKICSPIVVSDFHPISLFNVSYKIVAKVLANCLKEVLRFVVSEAQSAFVSGRAINDNVIIGHECLHFIKQCLKGKEGFVALKLDMSKAYDRVEWSFLANLMRCIGFVDVWVDLIMDCISTIQFVVLINGEAHGHITPSWSLRQGDPLSSQDLNSAHGSQFFSRVRIGSFFPFVSHLFFVNNSLVFFKANVSKG